MKCDFCGSEIDELEEICPICGAGKTQDDLQEAEYMEEDLEKQKSMDRNVKYYMENQEILQKQEVGLQDCFLLYYALL